MDNLTDKIRPGTKYSSTWKRSHVSTNKINNKLNYREFVLMTGKQAGLTDSLAYKPN